MNKVHAGQNRDQVHIQVDAQLPKLWRPVEHPPVQGGHGLFHRLLGHIAKVGQDQIGCVSRAERPGSDLAVANSFGKLVLGFDAAEPDDVVLLERCRGGCPGDTGKKSFFRKIVEQIKARIAQALPGRSVGEDCELHERVEVALSGNFGFCALQIGGQVSGGEKCVRSEADGPLGESFEIHWNGEAIDRSPLNIRFLCAQRLKGQAERKRH